MQKDHDGSGRVAGFRIHMHIASNGQVQTLGMRAETSTSMMETESGITASVRFAI